MTGLGLQIGLQMGSQGGGGVSAPPIYNSSALASYRTARSNRASAPCNIAIPGASWEQGNNVYTYGSRWVDLLALNLRTAFPVSGNSVGGSTLWPACYPPSGTFGGSTAWTSVIVSGGTLAGQGLSANVILATAASGYRYTFTGTSFGFCYLAGAGVPSGIASVVIDGGVPTMINNQTLSGSQVWASGALSAGSHTIDVTFVSGTDFRYIGFLYYNGDEGKGMRTLNGGYGGADSTNSGVFGSYFNDGFMKSVSAALCIVDLINNDFSRNLDPATYKTNMIARVADARYSAGSSTIPVLLMATNYPGDLGARTYTYAQYVAKLKEIADADAYVAVLDLAAYIPPCAYTPATPRDAIGFWDTDYNHPTTYGHQLLASLVGSALGT